MTSLSTWDVSARPVFHLGLLSSLRLHYRFDFLPVSLTSLSVYLGYAEFHGYSIECGLHGTYYIIVQVPSCQQIDFLLI